jgi:hypothetical protein
MTRTLTAAAILLAAITTASAVDDFPPATPREAAHRVAALQVYAVSCGTTVPPVVLKMIHLAVLSEVQAHNDALGEVLKSKQALGDRVFCTKWRLFWEPRIPDILAGAAETGLRP